MILEAKDIWAGYFAKPVLKGVSLSMKKNDVLFLLGANGVGKTTLFKTLLGLKKPSRGQVLIDNRPLKDYDRAQLAKLVAYIPQAHNPPFPYEVLDMVLMARVAHLGHFGQPSKEDVDIARDALAQMQIEHLSHRNYGALSGGEQQLVLIARALTQQSKLLVMDEPTSNLDYGNQTRIMEHIQRLAGQGRAILITSHMPNHAFMAASQVVLLHQGQVVDSGRAEEVITSENMLKAYGTQAQIIQIPGRENKTQHFCLPWAQ